MGGFLTTHAILNLNTKIGFYNEKIDLIFFYLNDATNGT
ncbi:MAG: hypothetical protein US13_C0002G0108 [candidate division TM6 bacterium GW2011_GWE2_36_25]|nr:MAG: hypothetical protein US03_C0002G0109 [candidate division TM6 bacterium GW2011_GWF2_36_131]KKQ03542.1 MAG: hypothetical protein US13_C0002G0108 [candidate division TM6 bacterium GW2011_GWE2_36_25]KKQ20183.1 MAG: hypothetical protein US32_C0001G0080 [candidate division TM6 bacterium GW2011_GWA2_36_9]